MRRCWAGCITLAFAVAACGDGPTKPNPLDARAFGAVGDGVTDDGLALQTAIDAAETLARPLMIPRPQAFYRVGRALQVSGATILGDGSEIHGSAEYVFRVDGQATVRGLKIVGRNGIEVHGGLFEDTEVTGIGDSVGAGDGWAIHGPTSTISGGVTIRRAVLRGLGTGGQGAYAIGLGDASDVRLEDVEATGTRWGAYVRSRSTVTATRAKFYGGQIGLELDRKPAGYPGLNRFGSSDIVLTNCVVEADPNGPRWDLAVPFVAGLGHVVFVGTTNPTNILNNYSGPAGNPPVGPPIGSLSDIIRRR